MTMDIRYLGHATVELVDGDTRVLVDPFLAPNNPAATATADDVNPTHIVVTHGHADHIVDLVPVASRTGAPVTAIVELAAEFSEDLGEAHDVRNPNLGGTVEFPWGWVRYVPAWHTSTTPKGTVNTPAGVVIRLGDTTFYHLGDTALFSDLALPGRRTPIDVAFVPIGGHFTMDRHDAVEAVKLIGASTIIPVHYNTFPPIETDAQAFKADVERETDARVVVLAPDESTTT
jgi:L-ascorbate metabolism protein UlaG (beta-lactamase superfamily)